VTGVTGAISMRRSVPDGTADMTLQASADQTELSNFYTPGSTTGAGANASPGTSGGCTASATPGESWAPCGLLAGFVGFGAARARRRRSRAR
jgi:hypothetical protein